MSTASEVQTTPENIAQNQVGAELGEFNPLVHPELALQTYESFAGGSTREAERDAFKNGDTYHLEMTYPKLSEVTASEMGESLRVLREKAVAEYGEDSLTVSSIDYRLWETEFLKVAARFNEAAKSGDDTNLQQLAEEYVHIGEALYGKPDQEIVNAMLVDLKQRYTNDDPRVQEIWNDLESGFKVQLAHGTTADIPALVIPQEASRELPQLSQTASDLLEQEWKLAFPAVVEAQGVLADVIAAGQDLTINYDPKEISFNGLRTMQVFTAASQGIAEQHQVAPFVVEEYQAGKSASWETSRNAVVVGTAAKPRSMSEMRQVGVHESMHALKAANGLKSGEPAMATGVFSRNPDGTYIDYLTFEEGNNRLGETVIGNEESEIGILGSSYNYYMMAGLVYMGFDDRQAKEVFSRLVAIEKLSLNPVLDNVKVLQNTSDSANNPIERFVRSTPAAGVEVEGHIPIFTKDIAYFKGRLIATEFWNGVAEDAAAAGTATYEQAIADGQSIAKAEQSKRIATREYFHEIFEIQCQGKIDPTDVTQFAAAKAAYDKRKNS